jgi:hypothetical protein
MLRLLQRLDGKVLAFMERGEDRPDERQGKNEREDDHQPHLEDGEQCDVQRLEYLEDELHETVSPGIPCRLTTSADK